MKTYIIYLLFFIFYIIISNYIVSNQTFFIKIILYLMIFCIFIAMLEMVLFFSSKYIYHLPTNKKTDYWLRDITPNKIFHSNFWSQAWKEYGDNCDTRYIKNKNIVHWIEIIHALTSLIYIYIIYKFIAKKNINKNLVIGILMVSISSVHTLSKSSSLYFL